MMLGYLPIYGLTKHTLVKDQMPHFDISCQEYICQVITGYTEKQKC